MLQIFIICSFFLRFYFETEVQIGYNSRLKKEGRDCIGVVFLHYGK